MLYGSGEPSHETADAQKAFQRNTQQHCGAAQGPSPLPSATSACGLEPAPVLPTPGETPGLFLPAWSDTGVHGVLPTLSGAVGSIFEAGLRTWVVERGSLAERTFCGTSFLGRVIRTEEEAGKDLLGREWVSGMGQPRSHIPPRSQFSQ